MENQADFKLNKQESSNRRKCLLLSGPEHLKSQKFGAMGSLKMISSPEFKMCLFRQKKKMKGEKKKKVCFKQKKYKLAIGGRRIEHKGTQKLYNVVKKSES